MSIMHGNHSLPGQTVLITLLILGFVSLGFAAIGFVSVVQESLAGSALESKALASAAANGCLEQAMNRLGRDQTYTGNETLAVGSSTCMIRPIIAESLTWTIETSAQVQDQHARYRTILTHLNPIVIGSYAEVASF